MPTEWVFSGHGLAEATAMPSPGGSPRLAMQMFQLPPGVTLVFYVDEAEILHDGWALYNHLMANPPNHAALAAHPGRRALSGICVPNYVLSGEKGWNDANGLSASGLFVAGDTHHRNPVTWYFTPAMRKTLQELLDPTWVKPGDTVHWLACRAWGHGGGLIGTAGVTPLMPAAPRPTLPPVSAVLGPAAGQSGPGTLPHAVLSGAPPGTIIPHPLPSGTGGP